MSKKEIPVYLFTGFLEAGKTSLMGESLADPRFNSGEPTLVILCEQGEEELDPGAFGKADVFCELIENEEDISKARLAGIDSAYNVDRIMIEYNGMWKLDTLYAALPDNWAVYQEAMVINAETFIEYNNNMRQLMVDKITSADPVIFNRVRPDFDKIYYHKLIRAVSRGCQIIYEYKDGKVELDEIEDPLPFDINAETVEIKDDDYAYFYRDISEDPRKYEGKNVCFKGIVVKEPSFPKNTYAVGRQIMICCAEDITYRAFAALLPGNMSFSTGDWIQISAVVSFEMSKLYGGKGPVLRVTEARKASRPERPVAVFG